MSSRTQPPGSVPEPDARGTGEPPPDLSVIVVHWRDERALETLVATAQSEAETSRDLSVEWIVIDNSGTWSPVASGTRPTDPAVSIRTIDPKTNLGFGGGANLGASLARAEAILILNPDARPRPGALRVLLQGLAEHPNAAGVVPRLVGEDGTAQWAWQLRPLPAPWQLLLHALFVDPVPSPTTEPIAGSPIEQPAAAALLLRRSAFERLAGFDPRYQPAWFEDVDLAARLAGVGLSVHYWPAAEFVHGQGGSVSPLGYAGFLRAYYRNLQRYLRRHAPRWSLLVLPALGLGMTARLLLVPLRKGHRAPTRAAAIRGLLGVLLGAISGWRLGR